MFDTEVLLPPELLPVVVVHTPLTQVVVVQVLPEHTVRCVVLCVRALADDVNIPTIVRLNTTVRSAVVPRNTIAFFS